MYVYFYQNILKYFYILEKKTNNKMYQNKYLISPLIITHWQILFKNILFLEKIKTEILNKSWNMKLKSWNVWRPLSQLQGTFVAE